MFNRYCIKTFLCCVLLTGTQFFSPAQTPVPFFKDATAGKRQQFRRNVTAATLSNLSVPLNADNEESWISAFGTLNLLKYRTAFTDSKIDFAVKNIADRSSDFKVALIELLNSDYPGKYTAQIKKVFAAAGSDAKLMSVAANYILPSLKDPEVKAMQAAVQKQYAKKPGSAVLAELSYQLQHWKKKEQLPSVAGFFSPGYLPGQVLVISFQRSNRNYPGIAIVRNAAGQFVKTNDNTYFSTGQLARSESNMPGYISMGNTPQGIFRMDGFDTSKGYFIGPTTNIQLTMPFEFKASHFFQDSTLNDTVWTEKQYAALLPPGFEKYHPMYGTYYAGKAGRNEIIAHGTTIDPSFYKAEPYYPYSPSAGCLVAQEFWDPKTGFLESSDQLRFAEAVKAAGGAKGYLIVIELDDQNKAVSLEEIKKYLPK